MTAITIVSLTDAGDLLAKQLLLQLPQAQHLHKPKPFAATVQSCFAAGQRLLLICATGIAVRTLAPVLQDKHNDPAVLVLDELGQFVIPLLSGHEGGANEWGRQVAEVLGAQLVYTTANSYLRPVYTVGMGCDRGCPDAMLAQLFAQTWAMGPNLQSQIPQGLASIDLKSDEVGLLAFAQQQAWPTRFFSATQLREVEHLLSQRSEIVMREVGCYGVAEAAALQLASALTGAPAELVVTKQKNRRATCAIARSYQPVEEN